MPKSSPARAARRPATNLRHSRPPKRRGELAELAFMHKVLSLGYGVAKPWGDSDRYDFIIDVGDRLWRAQVRSTEYQSHRGYSVHTYVSINHKMVALTSKQIDFVIAYIVPLDLWYVVPVAGYGACKNLWFYPLGSKKGSRFEVFREAWSLLSAPPFPSPHNRRDGWAAARMLIKMHRKAPTPHLPKQKPRSHEESRA